MSRLEKARSNFESILMNASSYLDADLFESTPSMHRHNVYASENVAVAPKLSDRERILVSTTKQPLQWQNETDDSILDNCT